MKTECPEIAINLSGAGIYAVGLCRRLFDRRRAGYSVGTALFALVAPTLGGCASSPVSHVSSDPSLGQVVFAGAAAAGGAALGNHFNDHYGAPIGAVVGLGASLLANHYVNDTEKKAYEEGYEQGKREARVEVMRQYWFEKTTSLGASTLRGAGAPAELAETNYNGGVVDGVRYGPRTGPEAKLTEPVRP